ncbi:ribose-phosphate pyrophosphokinase, partial [Candidatus Roizmanbacteria bacterium]|nr:ribose-phosphate pyrophosphokinase [Candidatus Roizmanbacteria bacterium]
ADLRKFSDGEIFVELKENVRGTDVFLIQPTCTPVNDHLMELVIMVDALRRASARRITAVVPYYGYARQDRKDEPRVSISSKLMADLITVAGANKIITMDLHADQIQGFFNIPVDHLYASYVFWPYIQQHMDLKNLVWISPDLGGTKRIKSYAEAAGYDAFNIMYKNRLLDTPNKVKEMKMIGESPAGKDVAILDDVADTLDTLCMAARLLKKEGAKSVRAFVSHPVLSDKPDEDTAYEKLLKSPIDELVVTDSIPLFKKDHPKIKVASIAEMFATAIYKNETNESISELYKF